MFRQLDLATLIHNMGLYSTFPNVSIALGPTPVHVFDGFKLFWWMTLRWGINCYDRWALVQHWGFLVLKVTCLTTYMYIVVTLLTHLELQKAENVCKTVAAINVSLNVSINCRSQVQNWKSVLLIFIVDYNTQEWSMGTGWIKWEGENAPLWTWHGAPRGLNPTLIQRSAKHTYIML